MKKLMFTFAVALSLFVVHSGVKNAPAPTCDPCPWVR
jgi:hypothetical protein